VNLKLCYNKAVGASGPIWWTFNGTLEPGKTGIVIFSVMVAQ
jgi:hypothetical protein